MPVKIEHFGERSPAAEKEANKAFSALAATNVHVQLVWRDGILRQIRGWSIIDEPAAEGVSRAKP